MQQRQRVDRPPLGGGAGDAGGDSSALDGLREQSNRFLDAADEAITRALGNTDSEAFVRAARQQGGQ